MVLETMWKIWRSYVEPLARRLSNSIFISGGVGGAWGSYLQQHYGLKHETILQITHAVEPVVLKKIWGCTSDTKSG